MTAVNSGFWDLPATARAAAEEQAALRHGVADFFDLDAADRAAVYDQAAATYYGSDHG